MSIRIGQGYDLHLLVPGRRLILGGVDIPFEKGLLGHSDADCLLHAITDSILGAASLPDIGRLFPDTDPKWEGADSTRFLAEAVRLAGEKGYRVGNIDAVILAQKPKMSPFLDEMKQKIASILGVTPDEIGLKAKTGEGVGEVGKEKAIECFAVCLLEK